MQNLSTSDAIRGALYGVGAVCIWASFIIVSRLGVRTSLTPWDVAAIRYAVAGVLLAPYLAKKGLALDRLGWGGLAGVVVGCGAPLVLLVNVGLLFAPAAHAGALYPGVSPLLVALLAVIFLNEKFTRAKWTALVLIVAGACAMVSGGGGLKASQFAGDALFLMAGLVWAGFTVIMKRTALEGLHAAAIAAVGSAIVYLPPYLLINGLAVLDAPASAIALQAIVQGVLTAIVALLLYGRAVAILGATGGAAFVALNPVLVGLAAIPILGEWPSAMEWLSTLCISVGVYVLSGGRFPRLRTAVRKARAAEQG